MQTPIHSLEETTRHKGNRPAVLFTLVIVVLLLASYALLALSFFWAGPAAAVATPVQTMLVASAGTPEPTDTLLPTQDGATAVSTAPANSLALPLVGVDKGAPAASVTAAPVLAVDTATVAPSLTSTVELVLTPSVTPTTAISPTPSVSPTVTATDQTTYVRSADGMVMMSVPAGTFTMGSTGLEDYDLWYAETPAHEVYLDAFFIDKTEVTNGMYALCVNNGPCTEPELTLSSTRSTYYGDYSYTTFPVIFVTWDQARAYCQWAGARLPSEAEWEKAARGSDTRLFPWGDEEPTCERSNFLGCAGDTRAVGSHPLGVSPYGVLDMAGNVAEWVNDWMDESYYTYSPRENPRGPSSGSDRVLRGGSWISTNSTIRSAARDLFLSEFGDAVTGFRCARTP
jgi:formylglycine-generating enzyme required for sulfatase activity